MTSTFPSKIFGRSDLKDKKILLTIGNFDGVHLGHQKLIGQLKKKSADLNLPCVALTLYPHPTHILQPEKAKSLLVSIEDRVDLLLRAGCDAVIVQEFNTAFSQLEPEEFLTKIILPLNPHEIHVGKNFRFGKKQKGDAETIKEFCSAYEISPHLIHEISVDQKTISSSSIRQLVSEGKCEKVKELLGRNFTYSGTVIHGEKLGRTLGFPTANIEPQKNLICPNAGIYACYAFIDGKKHIAAVSVGQRPTIGKNLRTLIEAYILDFSEDIYEKSINLEFVKKIREEEQFSSLEILTQQIQKDVDQIKKIFSPR